MAYSTNPNLPKARATALRLLLVEGLPLQTVANKCGVHRSTIYRWKKKCQHLNRHVQQATQAQSGTQEYFNLWLLFEDYYMEKQKGHLYGACQRDLQECKNNKYLREELAHETLIEKLDELIRPSPEIVDWLVGQLEDEYKSSNDAAEEYRKSLETRLERLLKMDDMLYDDKLAGDITVERYESKKTDIKKRLEELSDELLVADTTVESKHNEAIDLIKLTQSAYDQYSDSELDNDQKRNILTKLFDSVVYENNSASVKYSYLADSIARRSAETRKEMEDENMLNQTNKNDLINRGQTVENFENSPLFPIWQELRDDYKILLGLTELENEELTDNELRAAI